MTTLTNLDISDSVVTLTKTPRTAIREAMVDYCRTIELSYVQTIAAIDTALTLHNQGNSAAYAIESGKKTALAIKKKVAMVAAQFPRNTSPETIA